MMKQPHRGFALTLLATGALWGCAGTKPATQGPNMNLIDREAIMGAAANNLFEVVSRLRPQWLTVRTTQSFDLATEIVVFQNDMYLGGPDALRQIGPELAYEIRYLDGVRATAMLPGLASGRHVVGAIIVGTRPPAGS